MVQKILDPSKTIWTCPMESLNDYQLPKTSFSRTLPDLWTNKLTECITTSLLLDESTGFLLAEVSGAALVATNLEFVIFAPSDKTWKSCCIEIGRDFCKVFGTDNGDFLQIWWQTNRLVRNQLILKSLSLISLQFFFFLLSFHAALLHKFSYFILKVIKD